MLRLCVFLLCMLLARGASTETVSIKGLQGLDETRYHRLESKLQERGYHVFVGLPAGYPADAEKNYPTIYILDGGELYPMLRGYYHYLRNSDEVPEAILVGISYGSRDYDSGNTRGHDFTAPSDEREYYGGAANFQRFFDEELLPFVEQRYRSDPARRVIFGQSLGGQFVLFTAQTRPGLFWGHVASNPALHRNLPFFLEMHADRDELITVSRLFVATGSHDHPQFRAPALRWIEHWTSVAQTSWDLRAVTLPSHTHFSAPPVAFREGLTWLFATQSEQESR